jgi:hypothetical protein
VDTHSIYNNLRQLWHNFLDDQPGVPSYPILRGQRLAASHFYKGRSRADGHVQPGGDCPPLWALKVACTHGAGWRVDPPDVAPHF